jgi:uncharacterized protein (DUF1330 family)
MAACIIAFVDIHDRPRFAQDYVPPVASTLEPFGGRVVAAFDSSLTSAKQWSTGLSPKLRLFWPGLNFAKLQ